MKGVSKRTIGTSAGDTAQTVSTPSGNPKRILQVLIAYSAAPTYTGTDLIIKINSGAGAAYDTVVAVGSNNEQYKTYVPAEEPIYLFDDDVLEVTAPAGGGVITSSISIYSESIGY